MVGALHTLIRLSEGEKMEDNIYTRNGYESRKDYLVSLADDFGVAPMVVFEIAGILGLDEDFDGLVSSLEDFSMSESFDCED